MLNKTITINPINRDFLSPENFREQVAILYAAGIENAKLKVIRSWEGVGSHSTVEFDWHWIDKKIEEDGVVGIFHVHPYNMEEFSPTDEAMQRGFAKANGKKLLWHGVQAWNSPKAKIVCYHMPFVPHILSYDFGWIDSNLEDEVLLLPLPPKMENDGNLHRLYQ